MPVAIGLADAGGVVLDTFPARLFASFSCKRNFAAMTNQYPSGSYQYSLIGETSQKIWELTLKLSAANLATFVTFYTGHLAKAFYFYDPYETSPKFASNPFGTTGRHTVKFDGNLQIVSETPVFSTIQVKLIERA